MRFPSTSPARFKAPVPWARDLDALSRPAFEHEGLAPDFFGEPPASAPCRPLPQNADRAAWAWPTPSSLARAEKTQQRTILFTAPIGMAAGSAVGLASGTFGGPALGAIAGGWAGMGVCVMLAGREACRPDPQAPHRERSRGLPQGPDSA